MTASGPPERKSGWLTRLLDLGNNNRIIAAATLITIATGVPYLVSTAFGAFTEVEGDGVITREMLEEALAAATLQAREQAEAAALAGNDMGAESLAATDEALEALGEEAKRPEATPEERERVLTAYQQYTVGNPAAALAEFARVAEEQEARGAVELAAETWRHRGALQLHTDSLAATHDFNRARALDEGDAADTLMFVRALLPHGKDDQVSWLIRSAIRKAREEDDLETLGRALYEYTSNTVFQDHMEGMGLETEKLAALEEAAEVLEELIYENPEKLEFVRMQLLVYVNLSADLSRQTDDQELLRERWKEFDGLIHERIEAVEELQHPEIREAARLLTLANLHSRHALLAFGVGEQKTRAEMQKSIDLFRDMLQARDLQVLDLRMADVVCFEVWSVSQALEDPEAMLVAADLGVACAEALNRKTGKPLPASGVWDRRGAKPLYDLGREEDARARVRRSIEAVRLAMPDATTERSGWIKLVNHYLDVVHGLPDREFDFAMELIAEGEAIAAEELDDGPDGQARRLFREAREDWQERREEARG